MTISCPMQGEEKSGDDDDEPPYEGGDKSGDDDDERPMKGETSQGTMTMSAL